MSSGSQGLPQAVHLLPPTSREFKLQKAVDAVKLFYTQPPWDDARQREWEQLTGMSECTPKSLLHFIRACEG